MEASAVLVNTWSTLIGFRRIKIGLSHCGMSQDDEFGQSCSSVCNDAYNNCCCEAINDDVCPYSIDQGGYFTL